VTDHKTAADVIAKGGEALQDFSSTTLPTIAGHGIAINLPAFLIVAAVTTLLVYGIRESARTNTTIVIIKVAVVIFFISFGAFMVHPTNWHPFMPNGFAGVMSGAAIVFFAFIGFDAVSTTAEETKNPQRDMPIGMIASLVICTLLYVLMSGVLTGIKKYTIYLGDSAAVATAMGGTKWAQALVSAGALAGMTSVLLVFQLGQPRIFMAMARDGLLPPYFARLHPRYRTPWITTIWTGIAVGGVAMLTDIGSLADLTNIGTLFAFSLVCIGVILLRRTDSTRRRPFRVPMVPLLPILGVLMCMVLMLSLPILTWMRFYGWLRLGLSIFFAYSVVHSTLVTTSVSTPVARFASASGAAFFGLIGLVLDVLVNGLLFAFDRSFFGTTECLVFNSVLIVCNILHAYTAVSRNRYDNQSSASSGRNVAVGVIIGLAAVCGIVALAVLPR
jgi:APA family basic amino acid/polyamine antiporter